MTKLSIFDYTMAMNNEHITKWLAKDFGCELTITWDNDKGKLIYSDPEISYLEVFRFTADEMIGSSMTDWDSYTVEVLEIVDNSLHLETSGPTIFITDVSRQRQLLKLLD